MTAAFSSFSLSPLQFSRLLFLVVFLACLTSLGRGSEADVFTHDYSGAEESIKGTLKDGEFIRDAATSKDGLVVAYLISKNENGGSNYVCLVIVHLNSAGAVQGAERKLSLEEMKQANALFAGILELKTIDNKASKIEMRIGFKSAEEAPYKVTYKWVEQNL